MTSATSNRIDEAFTNARKDGRRLLLPYFTAGDPSLDETRQLICKADELGIGVVEVGIPFSDSIADGPVIQESFNRVLARNQTIKESLEMIEVVRPSVECGLVAMLSYSLVHRQGSSGFLERLAHVGFDGVILPDVPAEEAETLASTAGAFGLRYIGLIAPTTSAERMAPIVELSTGFVYLIAAAGTTGERSALRDSLGADVESLRGLTNLPVCIGFGISTPEQVAEVCQIADGAIVGSAIMRRIGEAIAQDIGDSGVDSATTFLAGLQHAVDRLP